MDPKYVFISMSDPSDWDETGGADLKTPTEMKLRLKEGRGGLREALAQICSSRRRMSTACLSFLVLLGLASCLSEKVPSVVTGYGLIRQAIQHMRWESLTAQKAQMARYGAGRDPSEMTKLPIWVVSLKRATERREKIRSQMDTQGIEFTFMDAIDGMQATVSEDELALFAGPRAARYRAGVAHERKKVAADVTNWRLMHRMVAENIPVALVMEDDFVLPQGDFLDRLNSTMAELPSDWDLFALNGCSMRKRGQALGGFAGAGIRVFKTGSCTLAVVIRREAAVKVLKVAESQLTYQHWDNLVMGYMAQTGYFNSYLADPPLSLFDEETPSIIEPGKEPIRDVLRP